MTDLPTFLDSGSPAVVPAAVPCVGPVDGGVASVRALIRTRIGAEEVHYGGGLVDGARMLRLFGDVVTEIAIRLDEDEGLLAGYSGVQFLSPVHAGDFIEAEGLLVGRSRLRRTVRLVARKVIAARYDRDASSAEVLAEPVVVCRAEATIVVPIAKIRRRMAGS